MNKKLKMLDLFSGAGGCSMGYHRAGFDVTGIDIKAQTRYPFNFIQSDAFEYLEKHQKEYDCFHASPPCQRYSNCTPVRNKNNHPDLIDQLRDRLLSTNKPFIIENVTGARNRLNYPIMLCGTMFGLNIYRHRYFECNGFYLLVPDCNHNIKEVVLLSGMSRKIINNKRIDFSIKQKKDASGIEWMSEMELSQAIPPVYTQYIGEQLIKLYE